jgi:predicted lipid-binding transport protein (Tim44 family)
MTYAASTAAGPSPGYSYIPDSAPGQVALPSGGGTSAPPTGRDEVGLGNSDFDDFEKLLAGVQTAWSNGDIAALRRQVTPEMLSYFSEQLATNTSKGVTNVIQDVHLEQGDLSEAWREGDIEYATVAIAYSLIDYTVDEKDRVVAGDKTNRQRVTELWTYMRQAGGGRWLLSAIQQA